MKVWWEQLKFGLQIVGAILGILQFIFLIVIAIASSPLLGVVLVAIEPALIFILKACWKRLKFRQIFGITLGVVHIVLLSLVIDATGEGTMAIGIVELPFEVLSQLIEILIGFNIDSYLWLKFGRYSAYLTGTIAYMFYGAFIGWGVDTFVDPITGANLKVG